MLGSAFLTAELLKKKSQSEQDNNEPTHHRHPYDPWRCLCVSGFFPHHHVYRQFILQKYSNGEILQNLLIGKEHIFCWCDSYNKKSLKNTTVHVISYELLYYTSSDIPIACSVPTPSYTWSERNTRGWGNLSYNQMKKRLGIFHPGENGKGMICI